MGPVGPTAAAWLAGPDGGGACLLGGVAASRWAVKQQKLAD
jgi:hypothetical protein